jgi:hypothetical protein
VEKVINDGKSFLNFCPQWANSDLSSTVRPGSVAQTGSSLSDSNLNSPGASGVSG